MTALVILKPDREKSVLNRHPWLYASAVQQVKGDPSDGSVLAVHAVDGRFLAWGYLNRQSKLVLRLISWDQDERIDSAFWRRRVERSLARRSGLEVASPETTAYRLVYAESDGLPGLIVDRYDCWLVAQFLTMGMERLKHQIVGTLAELVAGIRGIYERSDVDVRKKEGLPPAAGVLHGDAVPAQLTVTENGLRFSVDLTGGHKTGFYLDQRENRALFERYAAGAEVLDCFSYTGAFAVYATRGRAGRVTSVESSGEALKLARHNLELNGFGLETQEFVEQDVFQQLRRYRDAGRQFDLLVLDPPKFAQTQRGVERAARAYKDINWLAMRLLRPGGHLFTFSCSGAVSADLFQKILFAAALDAGRDVQIVGRLGQGADHPVLLTFPESAYLKGAVCRVD